MVFLIQDLCYFLLRKPKATTRLVAIRDELNLLWNRKNWSGRARAGLGAAQIWFDGLARVCCACGCSDTIVWEQPILVWNAGNDTRIGPGNADSSRNWCRSRLGRLVWEQLS